MALNASVELSSANGRRVLNLKDFITGPRQTALAGTELMSAVLVPKSSERSISSFLKLGSRKYLVISISMVAVVLEPDSDGSIENISISVGSCSAVACRLHDLEAELKGRQLRQMSRLPHATKFFAPLAPIDDIRSSGQYRLEATAELVRRAILLCVDTLK